MLRETRSWPQCQLSGILTFPAGRNKQPNNEQRVLFPVRSSLLRGSSPDTLFCLAVNVPLSCYPLVRGGLVSGSRIVRLRSGPFGRKRTASRLPKSMVAGRHHGCRLIGHCVPLRLAAVAFCLPQFLPVASERLACKPSGSPCSIFLRRPHLAPPWCQSLILQ